MPDFLIIANSHNDYDLEKLNILSKNKQIIVLDGAANKLISSGIKPHYIMGDFDSIQSQVFQYYQQQQIKFIETKNQNFTDLEKAIHFCDQNQAKLIILYNAFGGRGDHSLANLFYLKKYFSATRQIIMQNPNEVIQYIENQQLTIIGAPNDIIGVFALPECIVCSENLVFEMSQLKLLLGNNESVSNKLAKESATISVRDGGAIIIHNCHDRNIFNNCNIPQAPYSF